MAEMKKVFCAVCGALMRQGQTMGPYSVWYDVRTKKSMTAQQAGGMCIREMYWCPKDGCHSVQWYDLVVKR